VIVVRLSGAADTNLPCIFVARLVAVDAWDFGQRNETSFIPDSIYRSEPITQYGTQQSVPNLVDLGRVYIQILESESESEFLVE
jgi:hypothetical protein